MTNINQNQVTGVREEKEEKSEGSIGDLFWVNPNNRVFAKGCKATQYRNALVKKSTWGGEEEHLALKTNLVGEGN